MKRSLKKSEYVLFGLFILTALAPLATANGVFTNPMSLPFASVLVPENVMDYSQRLELRRLHKAAREQCAAMQEEDPTAVCADFNDVRELKLFLRSRPLFDQMIEMRGMNEAAGDVRLTVRGLPIPFDSMFRRFQRSGFCPADLDDYLPGFQELCEREVELPLDLIREVFRKKGLDESN